MLVCPPAPIRFLMYVTCLLDHGVAYIRPCQVKCHCDPSPPHRLVAVAFCLLQSAHWLPTVRCSISSVPLTCAVQVWTAHVHTKRLLFAAIAQQRNGEVQLADDECGNALACLQVPTPPALSCAPGPASPRRALPYLVLDVPAFPLRGPSYSIYIYMKSFCGAEESHCGRQACARTHVSEIRPCNEGSYRLTACEHGDVVFFPQGLCQRKTLYTAYSM